LFTIVHWLSKSKHVVNFESGEGFAIIPESVGKLKSGKKINITNWLSRKEFNSDMYSAQKPYAGFYIHTSNQKNHKEAKIYFSKIPTIWSHLSPKKSTSHGRISTEQKKEISQKLENYIDVSADQTQIIEPENCILAWQDKETNLVWDAARIFDCPRDGYPASIHKIYNAISYAGFDDWRIPTTYELNTILTNEKNLGYYIKKPLAANATCHVWINSNRQHGQRKQYIKNFCKKEDENAEGRKIFDHKRAFPLAANTLCVRGTIRISSKKWVNELANWAAKEDLYTFPTKEENILKMTHFDPYHRYSDKLLTIPTQIGHLKNLEHICFSNNSSIEILYNLKELRSLHLNSCNLISLPDGIVNLKNIKLLDIYNNPKLVLTEQQSDWIEDLRDNCVIVKMDNNFVLPNSNNEEKVASNCVRKNTHHNDSSWMGRLWAWGDKYKISETLLPRDGQLLNKMTELSLYHHSASDALLKKIPVEICYLSQLQSLRLDSNSLSELPKEIGNLTQLKELSLSGNNLSELPKEIGNLTQLRKLSLSGNNLYKIPKEIFQLTHLKELSLGDNNLTELPAEITQMSDLRSLCLYSNKFLDFPKEIEELSSLRLLQLNNNQLTVIPQNIGSLKYLEELDLTDNDLIELPEEICQLTRLEKIHLEKNKITKLPIKINQLTQLRMIHLSYNCLEEFPAEICQLPHLQTLKLSGNKLTKIPKEIVQLQKLRCLHISALTFKELPKEIKLLKNAGVFVC